MKFAPHFSLIIRDSDTTVTIFSWFWWHASCICAAGSIHLLVTHMYFSSFRWCLLYINSSFDVCSLNEYPIVCSSLTQLETYPQVSNYWTCEYHSKAHNEWNLWQNTLALKLSKVSAALQLHNIMCNDCMYTRIHVNEYIVLYQFIKPCSQALRSFQRTPVRKEGDARDILIASPMHNSYGSMLYVTHVSLRTRLPFFLACIEKIGAPGNEAINFIHPYYYACKTNSYTS